MQLSTFVKYFIPDEIRKRSVNEYFRARILIISSASAGVCMIGFSISRGLLDGFLTAPALILIACTFVTFSTPFLFRMTRSVEVSGLYLILACTLVLTLFSFIDGGFYSTSIIWFPILPLFSIFFSGLRYGIAIAALLLSHLTFLVYAHHQGIVPENIFSGTDVIYYLFLSSAAGVIVVLMILATVYLSWQKAVQQSLLEANQAKSTFLSGMSHELRTPLNSIIGFTDILSQGYTGPLNNQQSEYLSHVSASGSLMLSLVNDLLDIAQIESGEVALNPSTVEVADLIHSTLALFITEAKQKDISVQTDIPEDLVGFKMMLDEVKFKQILMNLLSNAIKFLDNGGNVLLRCRIKKDYLEVFLQDDGPGIPAELQEQVFDRFYQINGSTDKSPGTGLGLSICKHFAELHGGRIFIKNVTATRGCCFVVQIPIRPPQTPEAVSR